VNQRVRVSLSPSVTCKAKHAVIVGKHERACKNLKKMKILERVYMHPNI
jgi:hypothetical protein